MASDQTECQTALATSVALISQFKQALDAPNDHSTNDATDHPSPLLLSKAAAESLKAASTKLSLLSITPPFTDSAIVSVLRPLNNSTLPSLVTAALLLTPAIYPEPFATESSRLTQAVLFELTTLLTLIQRRERGGSHKSEPSKDLKQATTESTGKVWEACDAIIAFSTVGLPGFIVQRTESWLALMKDACEELKEWDPAEDVDDDVFGLAGSDDESSGTFTDKARDQDQVAIAAGVKDQALKVLSRIPQACHVVIKQRLAKMPSDFQLGGSHLSSKNKSLLEDIIRNIRKVSECIDESAEAMYMGNPELCLKKAGEARALTIDIVESVVQPWIQSAEGLEPPKEDIFIKRALVWIQQVDTK